MFSGDVMATFAAGVGPFNLAMLAGKRWAMRFEGIQGIGAVCRVTCIFKTRN
jgi:hypothetical protein